MNKVIEKTDDGSATLFVPELNEHYHSVKGARTESQHIFIDMGLKASTIPAPRILEIGFGTGLNAWLTFEEVEKTKRMVHYTGLELYPLSWDVVKELKYITDEQEMTVDGKQQSALELFKLFHTSPWEKEITISSNFTLQKIETNVSVFLNTMLAKEKRPLIKPIADIIYFDAFAPEKQPEMWLQELFDSLYVLLSENGILTTYCAKGIVRRMLQTAGFTVERLPGPPGGKREILRAGK